MVEKSTRLGRLMIGHLPALRRYALGLTGDRHAADDLIQDCIERALRRMDTLVDEQRLAPWLRSILFNVFIDGRRTLRSRGDSSEVGLEDLVDSGTQPDTRHEVNEILRATDALSPQHRQVLLLVAAQGLSYREVAEELGIPVGTVMSRLTRAREQLRDILTQKPRPTLRVVAQQGRIG